MHSAAKMGTFSLCGLDFCTFYLSKTCNGVLLTVWHCYFYLRAGCDVASQASVLLWDSLERNVKTPLSSEHINNTTALINAGMQQLHELILH